MSDSGLFCLRRGGHVQIESGEFWKTWVHWAMAFPQVKLVLTKIAVRKRGAEAQGIG